MAMIQGETGIIGNEIDFDALPARHVDRVRENSCRRFFADPSQLKCMPVKVNRVIIAAPQLERIEPPDNADIPAKGEILDVSSTSSSELKLRFKIKLVQSVHRLWPSAPRLAKADTSKTSKAQTRRARGQNRGAK